jgi:hypothetical protein
MKEHLRFEHNELTEGSFINDVTAFESQWFRNVNAVFLNLFNLRHTVIVNKVWRHTQLKQSKNNEKLFLILSKTLQKNSRHTGWETLVLWLTSGENLEELNPNKNFQEWWILNISTLRTGTILLPGTSMLTENDIDNRLSKSESDCIIVDLHSAEKVSSYIFILRLNFLYERCFSSFFYIHVTREKLQKQHSYKKFVRKMLMKLTTGVKFLHHFMSNFFKWKCFAQFLCTAEAA